VVVVAQLIRSQSGLGSLQLQVAIRPDTVCKVGEWASVCRAAKMIEKRRMSTL